MKIIIAFIFLGVLFLAGCEKQSDITDAIIEHQKVDGIVPMKVGYYWVYSASTHDTTGQQYPGRSIDTIKIIRDTLINNELWFIFNDGYTRTNRSDGVWFTSNSKGEPRLGFPINLNDSTCTAPQPNPCHYYIKLAAIDQNIKVLGVNYIANVYDWIFPDYQLGYRYYTVPHLGTVRFESYSTTIYGTRFLYYTEDLLYAFVE